MPRVARILLILVLAAIALTGGWLLLRDSALVAVDHVVVTGEQGPDAARIRAALSTAARTMTTLDVDMARLRNAVARYPVVRDLQVSAQFPHGLRITVVELLPVGTVTFGGRMIAVAGDGRLLRYSGARASLPVIPLRAAPGKSRLSEPDAVHAVALLAAAPYALISKISQVSTVASHGLVAQLRNGPSIYFGSPTSLAAKWKAAIAVLATPSSAGASYVDVTDPERSVAGVVTSNGSASSPATGTAATPTTAATGTAATPTTAAPSPTAPAPTAPAASTPAPTAPAASTPAPATAPSPATGAPASPGTGGPASPATAASPTPTAQPAPISGGG